MDVFVTGGTGFIGRWTVAQLSQQGHEIKVLARQAVTRKADYLQWIELHGGDPNRVQMIEGDLAKPRLGLSESVQSVLLDTEVIFHMGAAYKWGLSIAEARRNTVDGCNELIDLAGRMPRLKQFVHLSGYMLAAPQVWQLLGLDANKQDATQPLSEKQIRSLYKAFGGYEASKVESHFLVQRLSAEKGIPLTGILLSGVIGHSETGEIDQPQGIPMLVRNVQRRAMPVIPGTANDWIPLVTVDYLVAFITGVLTLPETIGKNYVVLDDETPKFSELLKIIALKTGVKPPTLFVPKKLIQVLLSMGLGKLFGANSESLDFLQSYQFDTRETQLISEKLALKMPNTRIAVSNLVDYLIEGCGEMEV